MKSESPSFIFLRDKNNFPVTCVAIETASDSETVRYGVSTTNPADRPKYCKVLAKTIAAGRLAKKPETILVGLTDTRGRVFSTVVRDVASKSSCRVVRRMAKNWIANHEKHEGVLAIQA